MSTFQGFSDAEIKRAHGGVTLTIKKIENDTVNLAKQKRNVQKTSDQRNQKVLESKLKNIDACLIPEEAKLDIKKDLPKTKRVSFDMPNEVGVNMKTDVAESNKNAVNGNVNDTQASPINEPMSNNAKQGDEINERRILDLEEFQARQKKMEEQNKWRKEKLQKVLADRTQRTLEEQRRLNQIQSEFKLLDVNLSNDVKILRKQIEVASIDFMEAQKRYNRVEKEFLEAKINLNKKQDRKDTLTEYLCAIIEKNEERKSQKLTELLQKLEPDVENAKNDEASSTSNGNSA